MLWGPIDCGPPFFIDLACKVVDSLQTAPLGNLSAFPLPLMSLKLIEILVAFTVNFTAGGKEDYFF